MTKSNITSSKRRVVLISHGFSGGGAHISLEVLMQYFKEYSIKLISTRWINTDKINYLKDKYKNITIEEIHIPAIVKAETCSTSIIEILIRYLKGKYKKPKDLINSIKECQPDYVMINSTHLSWIAPFLEGENINTCIYVREQVRGRLNLAAAINKNCISQATGVICISENEFKWIDNKNKHIIYNAINDEQMDKLQIRTKTTPGTMEKKSNKHTFVNMAVPSIQKGGFVIILATLILKKGWWLEKTNKEDKLDNKVSIYMLGAISKGFKRTSLPWVLVKTLTLKNLSLIYKLLVKILRLQKEIILLDYITDTDKYLSPCKFYIRSSITGDSWGRDVIEAMYKGKVCIVSGQSPFIKNGKNGFTYHPCNFIKLAKIIKMCNRMSIDDYNRMSNYSKAIINEKCTFKAYEGELTKALETLSNKSKRNRIIKTKS